MFLRNTILKIVEIKENSKKHGRAKIFAMGKIYEY